MASYVWLTAAGITGHTGWVSTSRSARAVKRIISVRTRIVATITLVAAFGMMAVGASVYLVTHHQALVQIDERLEANLAAARFIVDQGPQAGGSWASAREALETVVQRMSPDDNTGALGIANGHAALAPGVPLDVDLMSAPGFVSHITATVTDEPRRGTYAEDGVTWRYIAIPLTLTASQRETVYFTMAYDVQAELAETNGSVRVFFVAAGLVLIVIAGAAWLVAGRLLRPLRSMREMAEHISARSLSERLPVEGRDDVSELARTMNAMLDRLDAAMDSQRQLVSDVGHELKTPLTIVRGYIEVMDPHDPSDVRETQALATDELDRMAHLVQELASAARLHGPAPISPHPTDAADLVHQIIRKAEGINGATVAAGAIADVVVSLDAGRITQAMLQLAQNGVTHGGGRLEIGSALTETDVRLWVRDHGKGVPPELRETVFERFYKGNASGTGLGLNIVDVIARAHGGSAGVAAPADGTGALFWILLPRAQHPFHSVERTGRGIDSHRR